MTPLERIALRASLEAAIQAAIDALDALDGDADLEPACEDEGAQCDDEGAPAVETCPWGEGDQTELAPLAYSRAA